MTTFQKLALFLVFAVGGTSCEVDESESVNYTVEDNPSDYNKSFWDFDLNLLEENENENDEIVIYGSMPGDLPGVTEAPSERKWRPTNFRSSGSKPFREQTYRRRVNGVK